MACKFCEADGCESHVQTSLSHQPHVHDHEQDDTHMYNRCFDFVLRPIWLASAELVLSCLRTVYATDDVHLLVVL